MSDEPFPSGPWVGFYTHTSLPDRHRMDLGLTFGKGIITGDGADDIGAFVIRGRFDGITKECHWTKTYIRKHDVFYKGFREGKFIWGTWEIRADRGGFKIWPEAYGAGEDESEKARKGEEQPFDAVGEVAGASATDTFRAR